MNYILGSGLIAFIAKHALNSYQILPIGKSRYYQYDVATCDNYIVCHDDIGDMVKDIAGDTLPIFFKRAYSMRGQLIFNKNDGYAATWLQKFYGDEVPAYAPQLINMDFFVYTASGLDLFKKLEPVHKHSFTEYVQRTDKIIYIDIEEQKIHTEDKQGKQRILEYDHLVNTIPLDAFCRLCKRESKLKTKDLHTCLVRTNDLNFEGATELLIIDDAIDFVKCTQISRHIYQFFSTVDIPQLATYLQLIIKKFDIASGTCVHNAIPIGHPPDPAWINEHNITCIGSNAEWNDLIDLSTSIRKIAKLRA